MACRLEMDWIYVNHFHAPQHCLSSASHQRHTGTEVEDSSWDAKDWVLGTQLELLCDPVPRNGLCGQVVASAVAG